MKLRNKNIILTTLLAGLLLGFSNCCTKEGCSDFEVYSIQFNGFAKEELERVAILSYTKNSNYAVAIDSFVSSGEPSNDYFLVRTVNVLNIERDYRILLLNTGEEYTLSGFEFEEKGCNSCFPKRPKSDYYTVLSSYQVNGQKQVGSFIKISK